MNLEEKLVSKYEYKPRKLIREDHPITFNGAQLAVKNRWYSISQPNYTFCLKLVPPD